MSISTPKAELAQKGLGWLPKRGWALSLIWRIRCTCVWDCWTGCQVFLASIRGSTVASFLWGRLEGEEHPLCEVCFVFPSGETFSNLLWNLGCLSLLGMSRFSCEGSTNHESWPQWSSCTFCGNMVWQRAFVGNWGEGKKVSEAGEAPWMLFLRVHVVLIWASSRKTGLWSYYAGTTLL